MRFLSQALVSRSDAIRARLTDGYAWHRAIWDAFPGRPDDAREFLFRVDSVDAHVRILLLSGGKPESVPPLVWQTKAVKPEFLDHARFRFQVRCNPTMRRSADKRRLGIYAEDRLRAWFERKSEAGGFHVEAGALTVGAPRDEAFRKDARTGKHVAVEFDGALTVTDRERFRRTFAEGIGSAKGFGYGLLMLQPLA